MWARVAGSPRTPDPSRAPHLGCGWLSPGHCQPIQSQRGVHTCGWVVLQGDFMGVGIRHQRKHMKGRHQCSRRSPWASRKGFLGKAGGTALPRGLVQSLGSEARTQSFRALCSLAHLCVSMGFSVPASCAWIACLWAFPLAFRSPLPPTLPLPYPPPPCRLSVPFISPLF